MPENILEVFAACGKEIKALKETIKIKDWEIDSLREKNKALCERLDQLKNQEHPNPTKNPK